MVKFTSASDNVLALHSLKLASSNIHSLRGIGSLRIHLPVADYQIIKTIFVWEIYKALLLKVSHPKHVITLPCFDQVIFNRKATLRQQEVNLGTAWCYLKWAMLMYTFGLLSDWDFILLGRYPVGRLSLRSCQLGFSPTIKAGLTWSLIFIRDWKDTVISLLSVLLWGWQR